MSCDFAIDADSQLQTVRCDYLVGNIRSLLQTTDAGHIRRTLYEPWDYADALANQSLHWEPMEDRRHAYQWHMPSGDPTRNRRGGMVGANRLAFEAWPFFLSIPDGPERVKTRGFTGNWAFNTFWTWPLWAAPLGCDSVAAMLGAPCLQPTAPEPDTVAVLGIARVLRTQRILIGKTPNLTPPVALL